MLLALLLASAAPDPAPATWEVRAADIILQWNECVFVAADERTDAGRPPEAIVSEALAACPAEERAFRRELVANGRGAEADRIVADGRERSRKALQRRVESLPADPVMAVTRARAACLGNRIAHSALSGAQEPAAIAGTARAACARYDDRLRAALAARGTTRAEADSLIALLEAGLIDEASQAVDRARLARKRR